MLVKYLRYGAIVLVGFTALTILGSWILPSSRDRYTDSSHYSENRDAQVVTIYDPVCTKGWHNLIISADPDTPTQVSPNGDCDWNLKAPGHCIMAKRADRVADKKAYGPICDDEILGEEAVQAPLDVEWIWAVEPDGSHSKPFVARLKLQPS